MLPVLLCILLGLITGGFALSKKINITDAVREGARYGATIEVDDPDNAADIADWADKVEERIIELAGTNLDPADVCVTLVLSTDSTTEDAANCFVADPANSAGDYVVKARATSSATLQAFFFSKNLSIEAGVAARYERAEDE